MHSKTGRAPKPRKAGDRTREPHIAGSGQFGNEPEILRAREDRVVRDERNSETDRRGGNPTIRLMVLVAEAVAVLHAPRTQFDIVVD